MPNQLRLRQEILGSSTGSGLAVDVIVGAHVISWGRAAGVDEVETIVVLSLHPPNQPGDSHVVDAALVDEDVVVISLVVVSSLSLQPNQPGVLHVEVEELLVVDVVVAVVVVSSKQPHHPGVSQVAVRVLLRAVLELLEEVVPVVLLLSNIFQFAQSRHSGVNLHSGTLSYGLMTSLMTERILCVPTPTRQPLSATVSYVHSYPVWHADSIAYPAKEHEAVAPLHVPI
jgi:hypothetical protein